MTKDITSTLGREFKNVEIVSEEDLPRGCDSIAWIVSKEDFESYTIYEDCVTHILYAVKEECEDIPF